MSTAKCPSCGNPHDWPKRTTRFGVKWVCDDSFHSGLATCPTCGNETFTAFAPCSDAFHDAEVEALRHGLATPATCPTCHGATTITKQKYGSWGEPYKVVCPTCHGTGLTTPAAKQRMSVTQAERMYKPADPQPHTEATLGEREFQFVDTYGESPDGRYNMRTDLKALLAAERQAAVEDFAERLKGSSEIPAGFTNALDRAINAELEEFNEIN